MRVLEETVFAASHAINTYLNGRFSSVQRVDWIWQLLLQPVVAAAVILFASSAWFARSSNTRPTKRDWLIVGVLSLALFCALLPTFSKDYLRDPDEAFFVSAANKLMTDPVFYRSVDTGTSGALNIYPLGIPGLLGGTVSYVSARLIGWLFLSGTFGFLYFAVMPLLSASLARLAILPVFICTLLFGHFEFLHYSSERVSLLLLSFSVFLLSRVYFRRAGRILLHLLGIGTACGAISCAKLQGIPLGAVIVVFAALFAVTREKSFTSRAQAVGTLLLGLVLVPGLLLLMYHKFGVFESFYNSYVVQNAAYADRTGLGMAAKVWWALVAPFEMPDTKWFALGLLSFVLISTVDMLWTTLTERNGQRRTTILRIVAVAAILGAVFLFRWHLITVALALCAAVCTATCAFVARRRLAQHYPVIAFAAALTLAAVYSIARPGNHYPHYLLWYMIPLTLSLAATLAVTGQQCSAAMTEGLRLQRYRLASLVAFAVVLPSALTSAQHAAGPVWGIYEADYDVFRTAEFTRDSEIARFIRACAGSNSGLVVWGWRPDLYVSSGLVQGVRYPDSTFQVDGRVHRDYFRRVYVEDFRQSKPAVFVDAVGHSGDFHDWHNDRYREARHELFPELAQLVDSDYVFVRAIGPLRIYARRDLTQMNGVGRAADRGIHDDRILEGTETDPSTREPTSRITAFSTNSAPALHICAGVASAQRFCRAFEEVRQYFRARRKQKQIISLAQGRRQFLFRACRSEVEMS